MPHTELHELTAMGGQQERPADVYSDFISEEDVDAICRVLKKQRDGLQHLTDILTLVFIQNDSSCQLLSSIIYTFHILQMYPPVTSITSSSYTNQLVIFNRYKFY